MLILFIDLGTIKSLIFILLSPVSSVLCVPWFSFKCLSPLLLRRQESSMSDNYIDKFIHAQTKNASIFISDGGNISFFCCSLFVSFVDDKWLIIPTIQFIPIGLSKFYGLFFQFWAETENKGNNTLDLGGKKYMNRITTVEWCYWTQRGSYRKMIDKNV